MTALNHTPSRSAYVTGCRCSGCREQQRLYMRRWKSTVEPPPAGDPRHGTTNCYANYRCRCSKCRDANTLKTAARRRREAETS